MKITDALESALEKSAQKSVVIYRDNWSFYLKFGRDGYLILNDHESELTPYTLSVYDFHYDWKIKE